MKEIIRILGLSPEKDPNLVDTDRRVAKMYLEIFSGLDEGTRPKLTTFPNDEHYTAMVMEKEIPFYSMCAHHFVPFYGHGHIAYIPNERIVGLSKLPRLLDFFAKRPQLQERLTEQVAGVLEEELKPLGRHGRHRGPAPLRRDARSPQARLRHRDLGDPRRLHAEGRAGGVPGSAETTGMNPGVT